MIKLSAPHIFDGENFLCENSIVVMDDKGFVLDIIHSLERQDDVRYFEEGILCPGFVNVHCHLELSHLQHKIAQGLGMATFIEKIVTTPTVAIGSIKEHIAHQDNLMWQNGIQAVGDICNTDCTVDVKQNSKITYTSFLELIERNNGFDIIKQAALLKQSFKGLSYNCVPHSPYTLSSDKLKYIFHKLSDGVSTIHYNESQAEKDLLQRSRGELFDVLSKLYNQKLPAYGLYNDWLENVPEHLILVHNTVSDEDDIAYIKYLSNQQNASIFFCFCVNANQYINNALPAIHLFGDLKNCCLGTDSLASNTSLSILSEIKTMHFHFPFVSVTTLLRMAISQGARALALQHKLGMFHSGLQSGAIHISGATKEFIAPTSQVKRIV